MRCFKAKKAVAKFKAKNQAANIGSKKPCVRKQLTKKERGQAKKGLTNYKKAKKSIKMSGGGILKVNHTLNSPTQANLNASSNVVPPPKFLSSNIFLDILKVAPLVELADDTASVAESVQSVEFIEQNTKLTLTNNADNEDDEEIILIDEVNKTNDVSQGCSTMADSSDDEDQYSIILLDSCEDPKMPSTSTSNQIPPIACKAPLTTFISRIRFPLYSPPAFVGVSDLQSLRYFQAIGGNDVQTSANVDRYVVPVVSFNVLCQKTMQRTSYLYTHLRGADSVLMNWKARCERLVVDLDRLLVAGIFCLQEVENIHFHQFFVPYFKQHGFVGEYLRRTNAFCDGCAIFYLPRLFALRKYVPVHYNLGVTNMDRDNVGQLMALDVVGSNTTICVSNTHLLFNQKRGDVKIHQLAYLIATMTQMEQFIRLSTGRHFAGHILCGDFNVDPFSPIYRFITRAQINVSEFSAFDLAAELSAMELVNRAKPMAGVQLNLSGMQLSSFCTFVRKSGFLNADASNCRKLRHNLKLVSAYEHRLSNGEREVSTYQRDARCPDFIFYSAAEYRCEADASISEAYLQLRNRLTLPCLAQLNATCGRMPNSQSGSDHLPLYAEFEVLCPRK